MSTTQTPSPLITDQLSTYPSAPYQQGLRGTRGAIWRGALALLLLLVGGFAAVLGFGMAALAFDSWRGNLVPGSGTPPMTPAMLAATLLAMATLTPLSAGIQRLLYGQGVGSLSSVIGRFRWQLLRRLAMVVVPVMALYVGVFSFFAPTPTRTGSLDVSLTVVLLLICVVVMPLQAAGEEFGFRGLISRVIGSWIAGQKTALAVSTIIASTLFMFAHGAGDPWLNVYYFCFGVTLSLVTYFTGGLEGAVLLHATNNVVASVVGCFVSDFSQAFNRSAGVGGPFMLIQIVMIALIGAGTAIAARRMGAATRIETHSLPR